MAQNNGCKRRYFNPAATVTAVIFKELEGGIRVLLTLRNIEPFRNKWCLPGGHIDRYESSEEAISREVKEETGLDFRGESFGTFDEIFPELGIHNVVTAYAGISSGTLIAQQAEVSDAQWIQLSKALEMRLAFTHNEVLKTFSRWYNTRKLGDV